MDLRAVIPADRDKGNLQPELIEKLERFEAVMRAAKCPVFMTEGRRSNERQDELYAQGRTTEGPIVTNAKAGESSHNPDADGLGRAADYAFEGNDPYSESHPWQFLGMAAKVVGLKWGGDWSTPDRPHVYIA